MLKPKKTLKKPTKLSPEEQFWDSVTQKSESLIANLIEKTLPISAIPSVFNLKKSPDYLNLLNNDLPNSYQDSEEYQTKITEQSWTEDDVEYVAQDLTCRYFDLIVRKLTDWLSTYAGFESTGLAQYE